MATKTASSVEDTASSVGSSSPPKKVTSTKAMESKVKSTHPTSANMIIEAITELRERGGSSLFAIKKYMTETYKVDTDKLAFYIKKFLKSAVESGQLIQTKGKGASGSFKLPSAKSKTKAKEEKAKAGSSKTSLDNKKAAMKKTSKTAASAKPASPKKKQASSSKVAKKASTAAVKNAKAANMDPKSSKAKRLARSPTKPKAPKAKKVTDKSLKASTSRKVAAK